MTTTTADLTHITVTCLNARGTISGHMQCDGYVAPLQYGATRPCACSCHVPDEARGTNPLSPRDYGHAERMAHDSFYGKGQLAATERVTHVPANDMVTYLVSSGLLDYVTALDVAECVSEGQFKTFCVTHGAATTTYTLRRAANGWPELVRHI